jgi:hypothetical protein
VELCSILVRKLRACQNLLTARSFSMVQRQERRTHRLVTLEYPFYYLWQGVTSKFPQGQLGILLYQPMKHRVSHHEYAATITQRVEYAVDQAVEFTFGIVFLALFSIRILSQSVTSEKSGSCVNVLIHVCARSLSRCGRVDEGDEVLDGLLVLAH